MEKERIIRNLTVGCLLAFVFYLGKQIITLNKILLKQRKNLKQIENQLGMLAESFAKFLDVDEKEKKEIIRAINTADIRGIVNEIRRKSWEEFVESSYYNNPSYYIYDDNPLIARTTLYFYIFEDAGYSWDDITCYDSEKDNIHNATEAIKFVSTNKERVNKLETLLKRMWFDKIRIFPYPED